ncbi:D-alanine-D-alanine ligase [Aeromonas sp. RU39B]|jgi:D-alanine-D-alanine ligase|uniref:D-alanine--D-alanine ligase n=1 Tax=Aeromonas sp. RU39B TaxID=1907416 RepID=UPI000954F48A|nr:D-alanine--D-alanine ligase [Aeromonas sp. RU39B]SIQ75250.1 D-alanine-D-alanine ligase [Aeromonas sp. RU39B]
MKNLHVLLLCGGGGAEHEVSLVSANFLESKLTALPGVEVTRVEMFKDRWISADGRECKLGLDRLLSFASVARPVDYVVPCIHGYPGETGDLQSFLEMAGLPYLGCRSEGSKLCFNKISTKLWLTALGIPNTPYLFLTENNADSLAQAESALADWGALFVKAASQGSSVGCYKVTDKAGLADAINKAFGYSEQVLVEKAVKPRELEVAVYQYGDELVATEPGEICTPSDHFYTYEEKYSTASHTSTSLRAEGLSQEQIDAIRGYALKAFRQMGLTHLSRVDFFLTDEGEILLNEINTFPGMTPISMFPKLMEHNGHDISRFLEMILADARR